MQHHKEFCLSYYTTELVNLGTGFDKTPNANTYYVLRKNIWSFIEDILCSSSSYCRYTHKNANMQKFWPLQILIRGIRCFHITPDSTFC